MVLSLQPIFSPFDYTPLTEKPGWQEVPETRSLCEPGKLQDSRRPGSLCQSACNSLSASPVPRATKPPATALHCWIRFFPPARKPGEGQVIPFILTPGGEGKRSFPAHLRGLGPFSSSSSNAHELRVTEEDTRGSEC